MTFEEVMKKENAIIKKMTGAYNFDNYIALHNAVNDFCVCNAHSFSRAIEISEQMLAQMSALSDAYVRNITNAFQSVNWDAVAETRCRIEKILQSPAVNDLVERLGAYAECLDSVLIDPEDETVEIFTTAIDASLPFLPDAKQSDIQDAAKSVVAPVKQKKLTLNDILALINILLAIYAAIISSLPNEQLDRLAAQNEVIISQNETMINQNEIIIGYLTQESDLAQENTELVVALNTLSESIDALIDKADEYREQTEHGDGSESMINGNLTCGNEDQSSDEQE